jgi:flagellar motor switch protein FliG
LSDLVDFEDLNLLDSADLRAFFGRVELNQVLTALVGATPTFRRKLLAKLPSRSALRIEQAITDHGPVTFAKVQAAQRDLVELMCDLSRSGQVAFDDPADMVA